MDDLTVQQAKDYIKRGGSSILLGYLLLSLLSYYGIWGLIEPADMPVDKPLLGNVFFSTRIRSHILLSLFTGANITLLISAFYRFKKTAYTKVLYNGTTCTSLEFHGNKERWLDTQTNQRTGQPAEGNFNVNKNIIILERSNTVGEYHLKLQSYDEGHGSTSYVAKDLTKGGIRRIKVSCNIKISGNGSQNIIFVLKDNSNGSWINHRKLTIKNVEWEPFKALFTLAFDRDFYLRIDSVGVTGPPNSVNIKNLIVEEIEVI